MSNDGKFFCGILGAILGGPIGAGVGTLIGSVIDSADGSKEKEKVNDSVTSQSAREATFLFRQSNILHLQCPYCYNVIALSSYGNDWRCPHCQETTQFEVTYSTLYDHNGKDYINTVYATLAHFYILGVIAKCDGVVTNEEIDQTVAVMKEMNLTDNFIELAKNSFRAGVENDDCLQEMAITLGNILSNDPDVKLSLLADMIYIGCADGNLDVREYELIKSISINSFKINEEAIDRIIQNIVSNYFDVANKEQDSEITEALSILGCTEGDSLEKIKSSYKKLCLKFHPDTISSKNLPEEFTAFANEKFKEIQSAYEYIKRNYEAISKAS